MNTCRRPRDRAKLLFILVIAIIPIALPAFARGQTGDLAPASRPAYNDDEGLKLTADVKSSLNRRIPSIQFQQTALSDSIDFLRDTTGLNIVVDWKTLESAKVAKDTPITFQGHDFKCDDVLHHILSLAAGAGYIVVDNIVYITSADAIQKRPDGAAVDLFALTGDVSNLGKDDQALLNQLNRSLPSINFNQTGLSDGIDFLRDLTGANIVVNWNAIKAANIDKDTATITLSLHDVRFFTLLNLVLQQTGDGKIVYTIDRGAILISTRDDLLKSGKIPATQPADIAR